MERGDHDFPLSRSSCLTLAGSLDWGPSRRYCQGFNANAKNYREMSEGTRGWIKEVNKLFEESVDVAGKGHHRQAREAMDLLFDLLRRIDDGQDFVFFADEAGSWQVGVEYESYNRDKHLKSARRAASLEQQAALKEREEVAPKRGRCA